MDPLTERKDLLWLLEMILAPNEPSLLLLEGGLCGRVTERSKTSHLGC